MAYQTGTASSPTNLAAIIEAFAVANGWINTSGVLNHAAGSGFYQLTGDDVPDSKDHIDLRLSGANNVDMVTGLCGQFVQIWIDKDFWPLTYHLFAHATPEPQIFCFVNYKVTRWQSMAFGELQKYVSFTGGNYIFAGRGQSTSNTSSDGDFYHDATASGQNASGGDDGQHPAAPFWNTGQRFPFTGSDYYIRNSFIHAEIDGAIWPGELQQFGLYPGFPQYASPVHHRQPNNWNDHAVLFPYWIFLPRADSHVTPLGHIGNMHSVRMRHYDPAEIIQIGSDRWMIFPWFEKDLQNVNGGSGSTGDYGVAIAYDGP